MSNMPSIKLSAALSELAAGNIIILTDDEDRENEGDLCVAAEHATPEAINFMAIHGRGLICLALPESRTQTLGLSLLVAPEANQTAHATPFCMPVDARVGVTTGISAPDRAEAVRVALDPASQAGDLIAPGHLPVLSARAGGVLERSGHTEASVELAQLAGLTPGAVICEIMNYDGGMAGQSDLRQLAKEFGLKTLAIRDLVDYQAQRANFQDCSVGQLAGEYF
ncbi:MULTISPECIES: 3,4-dihydroxy-2-butanone-4-phosphate synthase [unclassified Oceanobacter]|uniref:3,4-dihydroxy-2-butanone-4-phosphate synthase n=1 Tax=unclassified Oceanobacter TaxID=2620260 RepID=UPI0027329C2E|nr:MULTISPECIES: 3,4-dihydroxy-2-butanone-4-phosphate synthase [unclassified Oceanobacter]MDP2609734.1 3,4-dihydroxy-2-butanone-4-phosphate synthase [Oceanobacter sp. 1_MG-2023]MDP2613065.1 3,4-dihydroxy-2-butanone-4-phosphate synthase [Oceanobacter sp. 2_MG-2023]